MRKVLTRMHVDLFDKGKSITPPDF